MGLKEEIWLGIRTQTTPQTTGIDDLGASPLPRFTMKGSERGQAIAITTTISLGKEDRLCRTVDLVR
jgi:hypothetical protein